MLVGSANESSMMFGTILGVWVDVAMEESEALGMRRKCSVIVFGLNGVAVEGRNNVAQCCRFGSPRQERDFSIEGGAYVLS